jgi:hypothetical protein
MKSLKKLLAVVLIAGAMSPAAVLAGKTYQVTGQVVSVDEKTIVVDKAGEKFELARTADTKVTGALKVGAKVTVYYAITAVEVEVKGAAAKAKQ